VSTADPDPFAVLRRCLQDAQQIGAISPGGLDDQFVQATGYFSDLPPTLVADVIDLGSGGGLPALPLALVYPGTRWVLVEAWARRAALLRRSIRTLGLTTRVEVLAERAELVGRGLRRGSADLVTARSFGPAAVTLECAVPMLRLGGEVRVSVRHDEPAWPVDILARLGLGVPTQWTHGSATYRRCTLVHECPDEFPRRPGVPERRPLF
jgi:16S rRNA (guanine527-N7)-methyltransferase